LNYQNSAVFHAGEVYVQCSTGIAAIRNQSEMLGQGMIQPSVDEEMRQVLTENVNLLFCTTVNQSTNSIWLSPLYSPPVTGFNVGYYQQLIQFPTNNQLTILHLPRDKSDPIYELTKPNTKATVGLLYVDFDNRFRYRLNGKINNNEENKIEKPNDTNTNTLNIQLTECFNNCPKYIQTRRIVAPISEPVSSAQTGLNCLPREFHSLIQNADTFFIGQWNKSWR